MSQTRYFSTTIGITTALTANLVMAQLPPEAGWTTQESSFVMYINIEQMANSVLKSMLESPFRIDDPEDRVWQKLTEESPMTLGEDVRSITLIGAGPLATDVVAICRMSRRADDLPAIMAEQIPGYRAIDIDGYTVHSWSEIVEDKRRHIYGHLRAVSDGERIAIVTSNWEHLLDTIAIAERMNDGKATFELPHKLPAPSEQSALFIYMPRSSLPDDDNAIGRHLTNVEWITLDLGASDTQCSLRIAGGIASEEHAIEIAQVAQGMLALGRMSLRGKESMQPIVRLIDRTQVMREGSSLMIELHVDAELFAEALDAGKIRLGAARDASGRFSLDIGARLDDDDDPEGQ